MAHDSDLRSLAETLNGSLRLHPDHTLTVTDAAGFRAEKIDRLVATAIFSEDEATREAARWVLWEAGHALGVHSASIQELYVARGRGKVSGFTVPAVNIRGLTYETARAMFRAARRLDSGAMIFELAKSELGYTFQRPAEYVANVIAAAIREGYHGPVFIQGDHYQFNAKNYAADPVKEADGVKSLTRESLQAGYYNIDIDASTLVDLSYPTLDEQQRENYVRGAELTALIRELEPRGITVSVGGEIGEVGHKNSTVEEFEAYMDGYLRELSKYGANLLPMSKVSVQTGTSHGGIPTADGGVAEVKLDFEVLRAIGETARIRYGLAGAVQHGASTLPDDLFDHFPKVECAEIHLATGFQNMLFDGGFLPEDLKRDMYRWLDENCADEKKDGMTDEQFHYKTRKKSYGPFKERLFDLPADARRRYADALEEKFVFLYEKLGVRDSKSIVDEHVHPVLVHRPVPEGLKAALEQVSAAR
ncbi:MAG: class II fructose-bisphosphate aldolase [Candidatus Eiseniibacteriota bacterium]